jgi:hypothetical protein
MQIRSAPKISSLQSLPHRICLLDLSFHALFCRIKKDKPPYPLTLSFNIIDQFQKEVYFVIGILLRAGLIENY